jgi:hypothetical protein
MGKMEESASALERALKYNPKARWPLAPLAVAYVHLNRIKDAQVTLAPISKSWTKLGYDLRFAMFVSPFKEPAVEKSFADGLIKAGLPGKPDGYYKISKKNKLTGEEIKDLIFGRTMMGIDIKEKEWQIEFTKNGESSYSGVKAYVPVEIGEISDNGKTWLEEGQLCHQWEALYGGYKDCGPVYRNAEGTSEKKDEYIRLSVYGFVPFSMKD